MPLINLSVTCNGDVRLYKSMQKRTFDEQYSTCLLFLKSQYNLNVNDTIKLTYKDIEDDFITIYEPNDLEELYENAQSMDTTPCIYATITIAPKKKQPEPEIERKEEPVVIAPEKEELGISCICGNKLTKLNAGKCYNNRSVSCDICDIHINTYKDVYHCLNKKNLLHNNGYDICVNCYNNQMKLLNKNLIKPNEPILNTIPIKSVKKPVPVKKVVVKDDRPEYGVKIINNENVELVLQNSTIIKTFKLRNIGKKELPKGLKFIYSPDKLYINRNKNIIIENEYIINPITIIKPRQEYEFSVIMSSNVECGKYFIEWLLLIPQDINSDDIILTKNKIKSNLIICKDNNDKLQWINKKLNNIEKKKNKLLKLKKQLEPKKEENNNIDIIQEEEEEIIIMNEKETSEEPPKPFKFIEPIKPKSVEPVEPLFKYDKEYKQIVSIGFNNWLRIKKLLIKYNGNVAQTIDELLM